MDNGRAGDDKGLSGIASWKAAIAALMVAIMCSFELGFSASAVTFPKHFNAPTSIAFVGNSAFVTDEDTLTLFNASSKTFESVPPTTWFYVSLPIQVVAIGRYAWVVNQTAGTISEFGPDSGHFIRTVNPKKSTFPIGGYLTKFQGSLWYLCETNDSIIELNGTSGKILRRIPLPESEIANPDLIALVRGRICVTSFTTNTVLELNISTGHLIKSMTAVYKGGTFSLTVNDSDLWVDGGKVVEELNGANGAEQRVISASDDFLGGGISISAGGGHIWVLNGGGDSLTELDSSDGSLVRVISKSVGKFANPEDVVYRDGYVWVVNNGSNSVSELDAVNGKFIRNLS